MQNEAVMGCRSVWLVAVGQTRLLSVAQVPVGTVIHLVSGEYPSGLETSPSENRQPWDTANGIEDDKHKDSSQPSAPCTKHVCKSPSSTVEDPYQRKRVYTEHGDNDSEVRLPSGKLFAGTSIMTKRHGTMLGKTGLQADIAAEGGCLNSDNCEESEEVISGNASYEDLAEDMVEYSVAELVKPGQRIVVAHGGEGGLGNASMGRSASSRNTDSCPGDHASNNGLGDIDMQPSCSIGKPGTQSILVLELKSIADVGLVGMPNAGKSTLLGAISRAKPVVGHYAFTTLRPNIGNLNYDDFSITVADIPGLIKGAHENRGLGHAFLRHIERTKVLAYVVDLSAALDGRKGIPPWEQLHDLVMELESHQPGLSSRPSLVVANKIDEEGTEQVLQELKRRVSGVPIYPVCAVLEEGMTELKAGLRLLVDGAENCMLDLDATAVV